MTGVCPSAKAAAARPSVSASEPGAVAGDAIHVHLQGGHAGLRQQGTELGRGLLDMGPDDDGPWRVTAAVPAHGLGRHRLRWESGQRRQQAGGAAEQEALAGGDARQDPVREGVQVCLDLGVHDAAGVAPQPLQAAGQVLGIAAQVRKQEALDRRGGDAPAGLLRHIVGQVAGGVAEDRVAGEFGLMDRDRSPVHQQVVGAVQGRAASLEEGRDQEVGVERAQLFGDDVGLHRVVTAQGRVRAADQEGGYGVPGRRPGVQRGLEVAADLPGDGGGALRVHAPGVGEHEEQGRGVRQGGAQGLRVPAGQEQATMDGLGPRGVVVQDDDLGLGHGCWDCWREMGQDCQGFSGLTGSYPWNLILAWVMSVGAAGERSHRINSRLSCLSCVKPVLEGLDGHPWYWLPAFRPNRRDQNRDGPVVPAGMPGPRPGMVLRAEAEQ